MSNELEVEKRKIQLSWNLLNVILDPTSISQEFLDIQLHRNIITFLTAIQNVQARDEPNSSHRYVSRDFEIF